jgi:DNA ligase (NAD+)
VEELAAVEGIGNVIAESVVEFLGATTNAAVLDKLTEAGLGLTEPGGGRRAGADGGRVSGDTSGPSLTLAGRSVVVTGTLESHTREEAEEAILGRGGKSPGSVSAKTWAMVMGAEPGAAKLRKAEDLGIAIVDGARFGELLDSGEIPES